MNIKLYLDKEMRDKFINWKFPNKFLRISKYWISECLYNQVVVIYFSSSFLHLTFILFNSGGDNTLPIAILRDAYLKNGSYNIFLVDWGALCARPCYPAAVANIRPVAKCLAGTLTTLRNLGLQITRTTCIGHSLGAHICGTMANYLLFRMYRWIISSCF